MGSRVIFGICCLSGKRRDCVFAILLLAFTTQRVCIYTCASSVAIRLLERSARQEEGIRRLSLYDYHHDTRTPMQAQWAAAALDLGVRGREKTIWDAGVV